jgi:mediator of RNA polymerase II transcription subunit 5
MDGRTSTAAVRESYDSWAKFIKKCLLARLDRDRFEKLVVQVYAKYPLHPQLITSALLQPHPNEDNTLDPRIPPYIQVLSKRRYIDATSILKPLLLYSSSHALVPNPPATNPKLLRWKNSYWAEEVMFYHVIKMMVEGTAFRDAQDTLRFVKVTAEWMKLFTMASIEPGVDMLGAYQQPQDRQEMGVARAAFVPLILRLVDNPGFLKVIGKPVAKGRPKASLA